MHPKYIHCDTWTGLDIIVIPTLYKKRWDICNTSIRPPDCPSIHQSVSQSVHSSVCPSHNLLLNHWAEFYQICYITPPHGKGVQEQHYFFWASICASVVRPFQSVHSSVCPSHYLLLNYEIQPNLLHHFPSWLGCERGKLFFLVSVRLYVNRPSICLSRYLLQNNWAEFNQTCYITSLHTKGVREQHYFSVRPSSVHLSVTLSPPKPLGGIQPNLLHHFPSN